MARDWENYNDYVSADEKRQRAASSARKLEKKGQKLSPVQPAGRSIAESFWGKAWCQNLESYSDYASRLPRGRSYLRQGAVLDLQITRGVVRAVVSGTQLYEIGIRIDTLVTPAWTRLKKDCAGKVGSLMDLLQGRLSGSVMEIVTRKDAGLFPKPAEIHLECSCPDWANLCKHVAATLYGVGSRLDEQPELLFTLRGADHLELIASATDAVTGDLTAPVVGGGGKTKTLAAGDLTEIFGIEIDGEAVPAAVPKTTAKRPAKKAPVAAKPSKPKTSVRKSPASRPANKTAAAKPAPAAQKRKTPVKPATRSVRKVKE